MVDYFSNIHIWLQRRISSIASNPALWNQVYARFYVALDYLCKWSANVVLPIYFRCSKSNKMNCSPRSNSGVIVSFTSFPKRIGKVWMVVESMLRQKIMPAEIHLWLSRKQFPNEDGLPNSLKREIRKGLQVHFVDVDIRSHKKYYYIFQLRSEEKIMTIDDDILYRSDAIEKLLYYHKKYPDSVIANYARKIETEDGNLKPYDTWKQHDPEGTDIDMFFGSGGGTLFPPHVLHPDVLKLDSCLACCPTADDIWLNAMTRLNHKRIVKTDYSKVFLQIINLGDIKLSDTENVGPNGNDRQISLVRNYCINNYHIDPFCIEKK